VNLFGVRRGRASMEISYEESCARRFDLSLNRKPAPDESLGGCGPHNTDRCDHISVGGTRFSRSPVGMQEEQQYVPRANRIDESYNQRDNLSIYRCAFPWRNFQPDLAKGSRGIASTPRVRVPSILSAGLIGSRKLPTKRMHLSLELWYGFLMRDISAIQLESYGLYPGAVIRCRCCA